MMEIFSCMFIVLKWVILGVFIAIGCSDMYFSDISFGMDATQVADLIVGVMLFSYVFTYLFFREERPIIKRGIRAAFFVFTVGLIRLAEGYFTLTAALLAIAVIIFAALVAYLIRRRLNEDKIGVLRCLKIAGKAAFNIGMVILFIPSFIGLICDRESAFSFEDLVPLSEEMLQQHMEQGYDISKDTELQEMLSSWSDLSNEERAQTIAAVCEIEKRELGIKGEVPLKIAPLDESVLGMYDEEEKAVTINVARLDRDVKECIETVAHEMYHAHQFEVMENLDFEDEDVKKSHYYRKAREWKKNVEVGYIPAVYSTENYKAQPIERDAREYAKARVEEYFNTL